MYLGQSYADCNDPAQAEQLFRKALELDPDSAARSSLARLYGMTGKSDKCATEARDYLNRHAQAASDPLIQQPLLQAHNVLGICLTQQGKYDEAFAAFDAGLRFAPDDALLEKTYRWAKGEAAKQTATTPAEPEPAQ